MSADKGKKFEEKFKEDWKKSFPNGTLDRLYDTMTGYRSISTVSDFICYNYPCMYYIECKTHKGASLPFTNITQYDKIKMKVGIKGVRAGVILWLQDKDKVLYIPISTIIQMKKDGKKSVGLKAIEENYTIIEIPSKKKRVYMDSDYSCLADLEEGL
jgi:penicillin-binding protein-related factor A (putative recombinase)